MVRSNKKCKPFFTRTKARSAPIERVVLPGKLHGNPFNFSSLRRICHVSDHQEHTGSSRRSSLELDLKMPPMHWRSFVLALAAHLACGLPAAGAPAMNPMPQTPCKNSRRLNRLDGGIAGPETTMRAAGAALRMRRPCCLPNFTACSITSIGMCGAAEAG
jgi:hypothetical protein